MRFDWLISRETSFLITALAIIGSVIASPLSTQGVTLPNTVINFASIPKATFGDPDITLNITQNVGVTTVTSNSPTICSIVAPNKVHIITAGSCRLLASNPGIAGYKPARNVSKSFTISKASNNLTVSDFPWISIKNPTADIFVNQNGGNTTLTSTTPKICSILNNKVTAIKVGTCSIKASNPGTANYLAAKSFTRTVKIAQTSNVQPPNPVGPWTIRQLSFDDTNSFEDTSAETDWVAKGWYHAGLGYRSVQVEAKSTTTISYLVTDSLGRPTPNKLVNFSVGKRYGGSNAKVQVGLITSDGADKTPKDQIQVTGTTNAQGIVSWSVIGLDNVARSGLYTQVAAWVTDLTVDTIDITNLEYSIPTGNNNGGGPTPDPNPAAPTGPIDSLFYQPCTGVDLHGQIANIDTDPTDPSVTTLAITRGRTDAPSGIWDYSVLATLASGNFTSATSRLVTVQVYSPSAGKNVLLRLQNGRVNYNKFIQAQAITTKANQWETLTFDFNHLAAGSQTLDPATTYSSLALLVDAGNASTGQKYYFKNFLFPGALISSKALSTSSTNPVFSTNPVATGDYLWSEEFNGPAGSRPNSATWKYGLDWNNFIVGTQPDLVSEDGNGNLSLGMQKCSGGSWDGAIIQTWQKTSFLYGKIEARVKIASDAGWFSAFYMFGDDVQHWPKCGEFDIEESGPWTDFGSSGTIHGNYPDSSGDWNGGGGFSKNVPLTRTQLSSAYHTYGLLWTPTSIAFTIDGVTYSSFTKAQVLDMGGTWPFDQPEFMVFSLYPYTASLPASAPVGTVLNGQVLVDWIHYSQYQGFGSVIVH